MVAFLGNNTVDTDGGNVGEILLQNITINSASDHIYCSSGRLKGYNITVHGRDQAQSAFSMFGASKTELNNVLVDRLGAYNTRTRFDIKPPSGRPLYIHPQHDCHLTNCVYRNCNGVMQHFSGGGLDQLDDNAE